ncbi:MAG: ribonuclease HII [Myxococcota bacterium]|nr:ribonuclease HII [Myxococcota bacterium]
MSDGPRRAPSLAALRERAETLRGEAALRRMAAELAADSRAGARALAERCLRRAREREREGRRLARLFSLRRRLQEGGARFIAGVDEVGVGPLAGPVVAAAVVLEGTPRLEGLDDSKRLTSPERERLDREIRAHVRALHVVEVWNEEIDRLNIYQATLLAMRRAVEGLACRPDHLLVDARTIPRVAIPQTPLVKGDARDASIAAASIVAKVHRDALMQRLDADYPGYGFASHKGYGTGAHLEAIRRRGPSPVHRRSFAPVSQLPLFQSR